MAVALFRHCRLKLVSTSRAKPLAAPPHSTPRRGASLPSPVTFCPSTMGVSHPRWRWRTLSYKLFKKLKLSASSAAPTRAVIRRHRPLAPSPSLGLPMNARAGDARHGGDETLHPEPGIGAAKDESSHQTNNACPRGSASRWINTTVLGRATPPLQQSSSLQSLLPAQYFPFALSQEQKRPTII